MSPGARMEHVEDRRDIPVPPINYSNIYSDPLNSAYLRKNTDTLSILRPNPSLLGYIQYN